MKHIYKQGQPNQPTFVLLHGTGGDETDLLPLAEVLDGTYNVLSIKGEISENGMARYFKRHGEGQYDVEDLQLQGQKIASFIQASATTYGFDINNVIFVGFSNGANMAIHLMLRDDTPFINGLLFAPLYPIPVESHKDFSEGFVFLSMGKRDPIVPLAQSERVHRLFEAQHAQPAIHWVESHQITEQAVEAARTHLATYKMK